MVMGRAVAEVGAVVWRHLNGDEESVRRGV